MGLRDDIGAEPDPAQRRRLRASAMATAFADGAVSRTLTAGDRSISFTRPVDRDGFVELRVTVTRNGEDVTPPGLNPIRISNPPTMVPDPAGPISVTEMFRARPGDAPVPVTVRYREDPAAALRAIVRDLLR